MMKNKWMTLLLVFSLAVNLAAVGTLVFFWRHNDLPPAPVPPDAPMTRLDRPSREWRNLDIPPEKRREIFLLRRRYQERVMDLRMTVEESRRQVLQQLLRPTIDQDSLDAAIQRLSEKQIEMEKMTIHHLMEMRSYLTNEQWQILLRSMERERRGMQRLPFARKSRP
ncbi:periplasmic heavy metal sensor [candidate division KSB1 bacterium]|nr:periplasmic heavy metal sensor [candidate division KSB1 bacterium]